MIVKVEGNEAVGDWNMQHNNFVYIYGVTNFIDDRCETTGKIVWDISWFIGPFKMEIHDFGPILPVRNSNPILVKHLDDHPLPTDNPFLTRHFENNSDETWQI